MIISSSPLAHVIFARPYRLDLSTLMDAKVLLKALANPCRCAAIVFCQLTFPTTGMGTQLLIDGEHGQRQLCVDWSPDMPGQVGDITP